MDLTKTKTNYSERLLADIFYLAFGAFLGFFGIFYVAIHGTWEGAPFREYSLNLYGTAMLIGAVASWIYGYLNAWASNVVEETVLEPKTELLDDDEDDNAFHEEDTKEDEK